MRPLSGTSFISEVCRLANLILVISATNAVSERSFSAMRRLKTYFHSTMSQSRLNHVMLICINERRWTNLTLTSLQISLFQVANTDFATSANLHRILKTV